MTIRILNYIASHLQTEHIDAYTQPSGEAALKLLEKQRVDIAVVDIYDGWVTAFNYVCIKK